MLLLNCYEKLIGKFWREKMKIMIHKHHRDVLPCDGTKVAEGIPFSIEMGNFRRPRFIDSDEQSFLSDSYVWNILLALNNYDGQYIAYISLDLNTDEKTWEYAKWTHVRILSKDNEFEVYSSQGAMQLVDLLQSNPEIGSEEAWEKFFRDKIDAKKLSICGKIESLQNELNELTTIRDTYF